MCVCVCVCGVCVCVCVCVCVWWVCVCGVCVCVCVCTKNWNWIWQVCVCVCERERERERCSLIRIYEAQMFLQDGGGSQLQTQLCFRAPVSPMSFSVNIQTHTLLQLLFCLNRTWLMSCSDLRSTRPLELRMKWSSSGSLTNSDVSATFHRERCVICKCSCAVQC